MGLTDETLMTRVAGRDREAFAALYDRNAARVYGLLVRMLPCRSDADDVLQDVFWEAWRRAENYHPSRGSPLSWLLLIARSRALDLIRKRATAIGHAQLAKPPAAAEAPDDAAARGEDAALLGGALETLRGDQQRVIRLAFFDGLTHQQIAESLELPLGTVKTRIRLGLLRMREVLGEVSEGGR